MQRPYETSKFTSTESKYSRGLLLLGFKGQTIKLGKSLFSSSIPLSIPGGCFIKQVYQIRTAKTGEGGHGVQLQNCHSCVEMTVGCGFTACKYMIVRTKSLNKDLFYVLLTCKCMCLL